MSPWLSDLFLRSQSDERLVELARSGHDRAFAVIVERYRRQLYAVARRLDFDGKAEDVVQQTFLAAFAALRSGAEVRHLRGWLHQILRHAAWRSSSGSRADASLDVPAASTPAVDETVENRLLALDALAEISRLPDRQQAAFVQTTLEGRSRAEVATSLGVTEGAVRQLVHRARASLRSVVTAITPLPIARWLGAVRPGGGGPGVAELVAGAGAAPAGAAAVKVGALLASAAVAAGVLVTHTSHLAGVHARDGGSSVQAPGPNRDAAPKLASLSHAATEVVRLDWSSGSTPASSELRAGPGAGSRAGVIRRGGGERGSGRSLDGLARQRSAGGDRGLSSGSGRDGSRDGGSATGGERGGSTSGGGQPAGSDGGSTQFAFASSGDGERSANPPSGSTGSSSDGGMISDGSGPTSGGLTSGGPGPITGAGPSPSGSEGPTTTAPSTATTPGGPPTAPLTGATGTPTGSHDS
jgi:RNA polymerase sigma factor (sigma-70 family)